MNWLVKVVRPKINSLLTRRGSRPETLWSKCPETGQLVFHKDVEANDWVIPGSGYHLRMGARQRLNATLDPGYEEIALPEVAIDPLKFRDEKKYADRLRDARAKTSMQDAVKVAVGTIEGAAVTVVVQD